MANRHNQRHGGVIAPPRFTPPAKTPEQQRGLSRLFNRDIKYLKNKKDELMVDTATLPPEEEEPGASLFADDDDALWANLARYDYHTELVPNDDGEAEALQQEQPAVVESKRRRPANSDLGFEDDQPEPMQDDPQLLESKVNERHREEKERQDEPMPQMIEIAQIKPATSVVHRSPPLPKPSSGPIRHEFKYNAVWFFQQQFTLESPRDAMYAYAAEVHHDFFLQWQTLNPRYVQFMKKPVPGKTPPTKEHRKFGSYRDASLYLDVLTNSMRDEDKTMYEIVKPDRECRWFADVEWEMPASELQEVGDEKFFQDADARVLRFVKYVANVFELLPVTRALMQQLKQPGHDLYDEFVRSSASRPKKGKDGKNYIKHSYHVNAKTIYFQTLPWAMKKFNLDLVANFLKADKEMFTDKIVRTGKGDELATKRECIMDSAPHSANQNLKTVLCMKADDPTKTQQRLIDDRHQNIDTIVTLPRRLVANTLLVTEADVDAALKELNIKGKVKGSDAKKKKPKKKKPPKKKPVCV